MSSKDKIELGFLFVLIALIVWIAAYGPGIWQHRRAFSMLHAPIGRWVCVINADAVSSEYDAYITKKYIVLGGQRFYSSEFRKWGESGDYILLIVDDHMNIYWTRLAFSEAGDLAHRYGITRVGCQHLRAEGVADQTVPVSPPIQNEGTHGTPIPPASTLQHPEDFTPRPDVSPTGLPPEGSTLQSPRPVPSTEQPPMSFWEKALAPVFGQSRKHAP